MTRVRLFIIIILTTIIIPSVAVGQSINPTGTYLDDNGDSVTMAPGDSYSGSAPLAMRNTTSSLLAAGAAAAGAAAGAAA